MNKTTEQRQKSIHAMSESPKTKSDVVGVGCDDLLAQKRLQLKAARRESKKAAMRGRHNWGDFNRNHHIKELELEIETLRYCTPSITKIVEGDIGVDASKLKIKK